MVHSNQSVIVETEQNTEKMVYDYLIIINRPYLSLLPGTKYYGSS
jgi:hypothetical protein